jgi:DNA-directed RNA polymerase specialized sigma24 family protein
MHNKQQIPGDSSCIRRIIRDIEMLDKKSQYFPADDDDWDQILQQLVFEAQRLEKSQRQLVLNQLIGGIRKSNRLGHPQKGVWSPSLYEDFRNEALQRTLLEICQKINRYNPEHPVMAWVNFCLNIHFMRVVEEYYKHSSLPSLDDLEKDIPVDEAPSEAQLLREFLHEDPEGLLKAARLRERPEITFQFLALAKYVEDQTWEAIADDLGIPLQTLCSFFNRRLQKLMPYFHKHLQEQPTPLIEK